MNNVRKKIIETIYTDLKKIKIANGYEFNLPDENIHIGYRALREITSFPSAFFFLGTDLLKEDYESSELREVDLIIGFNIETTGSENGNLTFQAEKVYEELLKLFINNPSIPQQYTTQLRLDVPEISYLSIAEKNPIMEFHNNKQTSGILIKVRYIETVSSDSGTTGVM